MDKLYYIWLELIERNNKLFNMDLYKRIIARFKNIKEFYDSSFNIEYFKGKTFDLDIPSSVIITILDNNIKSEAIEYLKIIMNKNGRIISFEDIDFYSKLYSVVFCYIVFEDIDLNKKNIYVLDEEYFSKYGKNLVKYFSKEIVMNNGNVLKISFLDRDREYTSICFISSVKEAKILNSITDYVLVIEAKYEPYTVELIDNFIDGGIEIFVVPSNIFKDTSYFSNYLIQQGANVLLNKHDLKYLIC